MDYKDALVGAATVVGSLSVLGGVTWRFLKPWLKAELIQPVANVQRAVTENGHLDPANPTLRDEIANLNTKMDRNHRHLEAKVDSNHEDLRAHIRDSRQEHEEMQTDIRLLKKAIKE